MEAIFFALVSFIGWGVGDLFVTISARKLGAYSATFWSYIISAFLMSFYAPFVFEQLKNLTAATFALNILLGIILMLGIITFREGLRIGNSSLVVTISASFTVVTTVLSVLFFKEQLTWFQILSICVIFIGLILSSIDIGEMVKKKVRLNNGILFAIISMFTWGIYFTFIKIPVREIGWFWPNYISFLLFPLIYLYIKIRNISIHKPTVHNAFWPLMAAVISARLAELSFNLGIAKGYTSIVAPIAGADPVLFVILAYFFLRDPITKQQIAGISTSLTGIVLLSFFSV